MLSWEKFVLQTIILTMLKWKGWLAAIFGCSVCRQSNTPQMKMIQGTLIVLVILKEIMGIMALKSTGSTAENISEKRVSVIIHEMTNFSDRRASDYIAVTYK